MSWTDPDGTVSYTYDGNGNVLTVTDANGTITREYDPLNRITKYTDQQGNTLQYEYDPVGNLVTLTYPDGKQVHYEYNSANQLITVIDWAGRETRYTYDPNGRLISTERPNGTKMTRLYNEAGQLTQQKDVVVATGETISQFNFKYDATGNIIEERTLFEPDPEINLEMTYQAANRLATIDDQAVQFDSDGNLTKGPLNSELTNFTFDSRNRLIQAGSTVYRYDAENQRIGVNQTNYVVNSQPALSQVLVKTEADGTQTFYVYGLGLIGQETSGEYTSYHFDFRGSTVALTDEMAQVTERFQYSPYGLLLSGDATKTPFLFNGMYGVMTDSNGLYYMRARFYSPEIKRFVNQDILLGDISWSQTLNRYAFVTGQPISYIDPFGLSVGQPEFLESFIPFWGSGRAFIDDIQNENWGSATFNGAVLIVEFTGAGIAIKIASKTLKACKRVEQVSHADEVSKIVKNIETKRFLDIHDLDLEGVSVFTGQLTNSGDGVIKISIGLIGSQESNIKNFLRVIKRLSEIARAEGTGATILKIKAHIVNPKLKETLKRRYKNMTEENDRQIFTIPLD
jgi:RHS repeat-associated protein